MKTNTQIPTRKLLPLAIASLAIAGISPATAASMVIKPTGVIASSSFSATYTDQNLIADNAAAIDTGEAIPAPWTSISITKLGTSWGSGFNQTSGQWLAFDLGASYNIDGVNVWGIDVNQGRLIDEVNISFASSLTGAFTTAEFEASDYSGANNRNFFTTLPASNPSPGEFHSLSTTSAARYVLFDIQSDHGNDGIIQLGEVRFTGAAIPEPTTTALLGLGGLALILRRRK